MPTFWIKNLQIKKFKKTYVASIELYTPLYVSLGIKTRYKGTLEAKMDNLVHRWTLSFL